MQIVDPHIHLWDTHTVRYPWLDQPTTAYSGDNRLLPQRFTIEQLRKAASDIEILKTVNIEANPQDPIAEVKWLQSLANDPANHGHPHGIVAYTDLSKEDAPWLLDQLSAYPNVRGVRQILNVHSDSRYDYVGRHFLREPSWRENLCRLARHGWSFDLQIYPTQIEDALDVIDAYADILFVINHTGMFVDRNRPEGWHEWHDGLERLARHDNTALKISGLAMFNHDWTIESFRPYVLAAIDTFGPHRCMFASNFPMDGLHSSYFELWSTYAKIISGASEAEKAALLRDNATRYYRLVA